MKPFTLSSHAVRSLERAKADILANPKHYSQGLPAIPDFKICGQGCIFGFIATQFGPKHKKMLVNSEPTMATSSLVSSVTDFLGLNKEPSWHPNINGHNLNPKPNTSSWSAAQRLWHFWPIKFKTAYSNAKTARGRASVAAKRIDHFIKTNGQEGDVVFLPNATMPSGGWPSDLSIAA